MREAKVEYDDIADMHWWMVDHIHYLPAIIYAVLLIDIVSIVVIIKHSKGLDAYSGGYPFSISGDIRSLPS